MPACPRIGDGYIVQIGPSVDPHHAIAADGHGRSVAGHQHRPDAARKAQREVAAVGPRRPSARHRYRVIAAEQKGADRRIAANDPGALAHLQLVG